MGMHAAEKGRTESPSGFNQILALCLSYTLLPQVQCSLLTLGTTCLSPQSRATCICLLGSVRTRLALFFYSFPLGSPTTSIRLFFLYQRQSVLLNLKPIGKLYYWGPDLTTKTIQMAWIPLLHVGLYVHFFCGYTFDI